MKPSEKHYEFDNFTPLKVPPYIRHMFYYCGKLTLLCDSTYAKRGTSASDTTSLQKYADDACASILSAIRVLAYYLTNDNPKFTLDAIGRVFKEEFASLYDEIYLVMGDLEKANILKIWYVRFVTKKIFNAYSGLNEVILALGKADSAKEHGK